MNDIVHFRVESEAALEENSKAGVHQFLPVSFDGQYFSIANLTVHSICLDYRFRVCPLQLFEFSRFSQG